MHKEPLAPCNIFYIFVEGHEICLPWADTQAAQALIHSYLLSRAVLSEVTPYKSALWGIPSMRDCSSLQGEARRRLLQNCKYQLEPVTNNLKGFEKEINVSTKGSQSLSKTIFLFVFQKKSQAVRTAFTTGWNFELLFWLSCFVFFSNGFCCNHLPNLG